MEDTEARLVFTQLIEAEPALPDLAPYVDRARRATRLRRMAFAGSGTGLIAAAVAAVLVAPTLVANWTSDPASTRPTAGSAPAAEPDPREAHAARLTAALRASTAQWLPDGATLKESPSAGAATAGDPKTGKQLPVGPQPGTGPLAFSTDDGYYQATALVSKSPRLSDLNVTVAAPDLRLKQCGPSLPARVAGGKCTSRQTADGETVVIKTGLGNSKFPFKSREVIVFRHDGTMVMVGELSEPPTLSTGQQW